MDELTLQEQAALWIRIKQLQAKAEELRENSEAVADGLFQLQHLTDQAEAAHQQMRDDVADLQRKAEELHRRADALLDDHQEDDNARPE